MKFSKMIKVDFDTFNKIPYKAVMKKVHWRVWNNVVSAAPSVFDIIDSISLEVKHLHDTQKTESSILSWSTNK